eukprot:1570311-Alexandrium_andersonii.AAC.1
MGPHGSLRQRCGRQQQQLRQSPPRERSRARSPSRRALSADSGEEPKHKVVYWTRPHKLDLRWRAKAVSYTHLTLPTICSV